MLSHYGFASKDTEPKNFTQSLDRSDARSSSLPDQGGVGSGVENGETAQWGTRHGLLCCLTAHSGNAPIKSIRVVGCNLTFDKLRNFNLCSFCHRRKAQGRPLHPWMTLAFPPAMQRAASVRKEADRTLISRLHTSPP